MANHTLAQNLTRLNKAKEDIADAIVARGGSATHTDGLESMPTSIQAIPNQYAQEDNGKVVSNGSLISQTSTTATTNGTIDTTTNNEVVVAVPNTYTQSDEGKVVDNGTLVAQGSDSVTENGVVDTTLISSLLVNVSGCAVKLTPTTAKVDTTKSEAYLFDADIYVIFFGYIYASSSISTVNFDVPSGFDLSKIGNKLSLSVYNRKTSSGSQSHPINATFDSQNMTASFPVSSANELVFIGIYEKSS